MRCDLRTDRLRKGRRVADCSGVTIWVLWPVGKVSEKCLTTVGPTWFGSFHEGES